MVVDIIWKLLRKSMSKKLYDKMRKCKLGRFSSYYTFDTFADISNHYIAQNLHPENKIVVELGSGMQFFTALNFLNHGASRVILVDPVFHNCDYQPVLKRHLDEFKKRVNPSKMVDTSRISMYLSLSDLSGSLNNSIDLMYSHFVLEHIRNIPDFYVQTKRLLSSNGVCFSSVDLTDHTYHIFDSKQTLRQLYKKNMLCHLQYSDLLMGLISDKRTWVNRLLFPGYVNQAVEHGFSILGKKLQLCNRTKIHTDVLKRIPKNIDEKELYVSHFDLLLQKNALVA